MTCVIQEWIHELPWKMQTVLILGCRGCDGVPKENPTKQYSRLLRSVVFHNADKSTNFMVDQAGERREFLDYCEGLPLHYVTHFAHACVIVAYNHPNNSYKLLFKTIYVDLCRLMHMGSESMEELTNRLGT